MKKDANLDFNGMSGDGVNRKSGCYTGNQYGATMPMNVGIGPRKGNASSAAISLGAPAAKKTIATAAQGGKINGGATAKGFGNADKINVGIGPRKGNE